MLHTTSPSQSGDRSFATLLTICCLVTFGCYFSVSMRLPVVPLYARGSGVTTAQIGTVNAAFYLMAGLFAVPSGFMAGFFGRRRMAVAGSMILCTGMLLLYTGRSYPALAGIYLLLGCGIAAFGPTMMAWVADITPPTHLGRAYGWYTTALFCGLGLGPAVGGVLGQWLGLQWVFPIGGALVAVNLWAVRRFLPDSAGDLRRREKPDPLGTLLKRMLAHRPLIGCWLLTFGACLASGMFFTFMPLHADNRGLEVERIGIVFFVQALTNALSRIPFGAFSDHVGQRKHLALAGALLTALSIAGFGPARTFFQFVLAGICLGVSMAVAFTAMGALIAESVPRELRGPAMGGYNSSIYFGMMTGSIGLGPVIEAVGFVNGFLLTGLSLLPFIAFFAWSMRGFRKEEDNEDDTSSPYRK